LDVFKKLLLSDAEAFVLVRNVSAGTKSIYDESVLQATERSDFNCFKYFLLTLRTAI
jgi:hypothetical protein